MFDKLIEKVKAQPKTIVFTEGTDARIQSAAARLLKEGLMSVILVGNVDEVKASAEKSGFDISKAQIIDPATYPDMDGMVDTILEYSGKELSTYPTMPVGMCYKNKALYICDVFSRRVYILETKE